MLNKSAISLFLVLMLCITFSTAEAIGQRQDAQVSVPYIISQPCASCTYINISILTKDGILLENQPLSNNGSTWIYSFTPNSSLRYDVNGIGDKDGLNSSFAFWFDVTLSGEQNNTTIIISDIILILFFMVLLGLVYNASMKTDFKAWNEKILDNHKNIGETFAKGFVYTIFKNTFIWFYFIGWLIILVLKDVLYRFNSAEIYSYFTIAANIYSLGLFLVLAFMIGYLISYMKETINILTEDSWGING